MSDEVPLIQAMRDRLFPTVDVRLRRGEHIDADADAESYVFLQQHEPALTGYYDLYRCSLIHDPSGFWMLIPPGSGEPILRARPLTRRAMMVGFALAKILLDPASLELGLVVDRKRIIETMEALFGEQDAILSALATRQKPSTKARRVQVIHEEVDRGLRELQTLGFITHRGEERYEIRKAVSRFLTPARTDDYHSALAELTASSQAALLDPVRREADDDRTSTTEESP